MAADAQYVRWRNGLIDLAEAMADGRCPRPDDATEAELRGWSWRWDAAFHRAMAELTSDPLGRPNQEAN